MSYRSSASLCAALAAVVLIAACSTDEDGSTASNNIGTKTPGHDAGTSSEGGSVLDGGSGGGTIGTDSAPGACPGECAEEETGAGTSNPFKPGQNESSNVIKDPSGALVLDRSGSLSPNLIWIANSPQGAVAKVDTTTFQELGRYDSGNADPSRTSVNAIGDVYVGNRGGQSVTKISASGIECPDTNGDGVITTSMGPGDILPFGQDDCVLWQTNLGGDIRGVAAQDITKEVITDPDIPPQIVVKRYVWAGGLHGKVYKLDGETGEILLTTDAPTPIYGLAIDGNGQLWMTGGGGGGHLGRLDTNVCVDDASCAVQVCEVSCQNGAPQNGVYNASCPTTCDTETKQRVLIQDGTYGITVDFMQRVWLGGGSGMKRYDPAAPEATRLTGTMHGFTHGVTADAKGWIWGAQKPNVVRMDGDSMEYTTFNFADSKGMAVDRDGKIWIVGQQQSAHVIEPGPGLQDANLIPDAVTGLVQPYTYSDMTGLQATLAKNDPGFYREQFEGCAEGKSTSWLELSWDVDTPPDTSVMFRVRSANTAAALETAKWVTVATIPSDVSPALLESKMAAQGVSPERFLEVEVWLSVAKVDPTGLLTPKVNSFSVLHGCPPNVN